MSTRKKPCNVKRTTGKTFKGYCEEADLLQMDLDSDDPSAILQKLDDFKRYKRNDVETESCSSASDTDTESDSSQSESDDSYERGNITSDPEQCSGSDDDCNNDDEDEEPKPRRKRKNKSRKSRNSLWQNLDAPQCPHPPAPPVVIRGSKRRNHAVVKPDQPEEAKYLIQLLRNRTTLRPALKATESRNCEVLEENPIEKTLKLMKVGNAVRDWTALAKSKYVQSPNDVVFAHFKQSYMASQRRQLRREFLYFAETVDRKSSPPYPFWMTFCHMEALRHPLRKELQYVDWEDLTAVVTCCTAEEAVKLLFGLPKLSVLLTKLLDHLAELQGCLRKAAQNKLKLIERFRELESQIESKSRKFDEFCHWGKKRLLQSLMSPYFKVSVVDNTELVEPEVVSVESGHRSAPFFEKKQKWTAKDMLTLKKIIVDIVVEKEYQELMHRYSYRKSRIDFQECQQLSQKAQSGKGLDEVGERHSKERFRRGMISKGAFNKTAGRKAAADIPIPLPAASMEATKGTSYGQNLTSWRQQQESALKKLTFENIFQTKSFDKIDWHKVASRMVTETSKDRGASDCYLVCLHVIHPTFSNKRWSAAEVKKLMDLGKGGQAEWDDIARELPNRTRYQCFFKYRNRSVQGEVMTGDSEIDSKIHLVLSAQGPKWNTVVEKIADPCATKHQVQERWKKTCNPMIRNGAFTRVEDALLLLIIEKLRCFIRREGHFGILLTYLPWRFETVWRDRASSLFSNWIVPWTVEEDKKLLALAEAQGERKDWQQIAEQFTSFKNRKGCLTRHKILTSKIGNGPGKFRSVEEYHEAYSMTRYNVFQYKHLREVLQLLKNVEDSAPTSKKFRRLSEKRPPDDWELRWFLLDFDREIVHQARSNLEQYIHTRDLYWKEWKQENWSIRKTFDRRTFHRDDPKSVASAIHIRGLEMVPQESFDDLSTFECQVYFHYARFKRTKPLKKDTVRKYIPDAQALRLLPEIRRIVNSAPESTQEQGHSPDLKIIHRRTRSRICIGPTCDSQGILSAVHENKTSTEKKHVLKKRGERVCKEVTRKSATKQRTGKRSQPTKKDPNKSKDRKVVIKRVPTRKVVVKKISQQKECVDHVPRNKIAPHPAKNNSRENIKLPLLTPTVPATPVGKKRKRQPSRACSKRVLKKANLAFQREEVQFV